jgi:hypothetical protein
MSAARSAVRKYEFAAPRKDFSHRHPFVLLHELVDVDARQIEAPRECPRQVVLPAP